ncbi:MAG TPA: acylphosphatase [Acidimicrobiales bacterium]|nr:acylphosphatase [Acidimicrobiales bacterium]
MSAAVRRRVLVDGRVQGVLFRESCRRKALSAGLSGWARNLDDGRVEVVVEGAVDDVDGLVAWCRTGPKHAVVTAVQVIDERPEGIDGFRTC